MTTQLVDDLGSGFVVDERVAEFAAGGTRFPKSVSEVDVARQLENKHKVLSRLDIKPFEVTTEEALENWVDAAAKQVKRYCVCVELFQEAWDSACTGWTSTTVGMTPLCESHEELVSAIARQLFKGSRYVMELESEIFAGRRQGSVAAAQGWLRQRTWRYLVLCKRWSIRPGISGTRLVESLLGSLHPSVENEVRRLAEVGSVEDVVMLATRIENDMRRLNMTLPQPMTALPAEIQQAVHDHRVVPGVRRYGFCMGCGGPDHWYKDCQLKTSRCARCNCIGHISTVCPNIALKDEVGRVNLLVKHKPSATEVKHRRDKSGVDRMATAEGVLQALRSIATQRSERSNLKRKEKKAQAGWVPKRKQVHHPVNTADTNNEPNKETLESDSNSEEEDIIASALDLFIMDSQPAGRQAFKVTACINGHRDTVIVDTGAARSICSTAAAVKYGLTYTDLTARFQGLGKAEGRCTSPVTLTIGTRSCPVEFYVVDVPNCPSLVGIGDLTSLNVLIDPVKAQLLDRETHETIAVAWEQAKVLEEKFQQPDLVEAKGEQVDLVQKGREMYDELTKDSANPAAKQQLWHLLEQYQACWLSPRVGRVKYSLRIDVTGPPCKQRLRKLNAILKGELEDQLVKLEAAGVLEPSESEWGSCPVFVQKKGGTWRMCIDYREVNKRIKADSYPIPLLMDGLHTAAHHRYYCSFDLQHGFWNIPLHPQSRDITAVITHRGLRQFTVLPFGLKVSPAKFQRVMDVIFEPMVNDGIFVYFDDIVIFGDTINEILRRVERFLELCVDNGLFLRLSKSELLKTKVHMLGHVVGACGMSPDPAKVEAVQRSRPPMNKDELRSFLGSVGYLRAYIPHYASMTACLSNLLKKNVQFNWSEECQQAFHELKYQLAETVLLSAPHGNGKFLIVSDASSKGIGSALLQIQSGQPVLLEFGSKKFSEAELVWDTREKEAFGIKWAVDHYKDYIKAGKAVVLTDHESLKWMDHAQDGKVQRWALYLQQFDLEIVHIAGKHNLIADWLSRCNTDESDDIAAEIVIPTFVAHTSSPFEQYMMPRVPTKEELVTGYQQMSEEEIKSTVLAGDGVRYSAKSGRLYIPRTLRDEVIYWFHAGKYGGHGGVNSTIRRMKKWVAWEGMHKDVATFIRACLPCQRHAIPQKPRYLTGVLTKPLPLQIISVDFVGPRMWGGQEAYFIVVVDHATRFLQARRVASPTAAEGISFISQFWVSIFMAPEVVLTDRGSPFLAAEFKEYVLEELQAHHVFTSPYYPQGNAINEASHSALEKSLKASEAMSVADFDVVLRDTVCVHNAIPHSATGESPFCAMMGFEPLFPGWQQFRKTESQRVRKETLREIRNKALARAMITTDRLRVETPKELHEGQWVIYPLSDYEVKVQAGKRAPGMVVHKYNPTWSLPCKIVRVKDSTVIVRELGIGSSTRQVPRSQVKILENGIPVPLFEFNIRHITRSAPVNIRYKTVADSPGGYDWETVVSAAVGSRNLKRARSSVGLEALR